jgi:meso-butanediol dehydrogenase/(S,S)-butanediol dehydrogenase/diacetyl reductase
MTSTYQYDFRGLRVFLTGGARGMGKGIAEAFADWGATVGITDSNEAGAAETAQAIVARGGQAMSHHIDVTDEHSVQKALDAFCECAGGIDLSINAAGVLSVHSVVDMDVKEWRRVLDANATGAFIVSRTAASAMIARQTSGSIVCIASIGGKLGSAGLAHYSASKFAVVGFVQSFAHELGDHGIRVNAVCPGTVHTQMIDDLAAGWAMSVEDLLDLQIQKRPQTPAEIALGIAGLHVNEAVTGQSLNVDGGTVFY